MTFPICCGVEVAVGHHCSDATNDVAIESAADDHGEGYEGPLWIGLRTGQPGTARPRAWAGPGPGRFVFILYISYIFGYIYSDMFGYILVY